MAATGSLSAKPPSSPPKPQDPFLSWRPLGHNRSDRSYAATASFDTLNKCPFSKQQPRPVTFYLTNLPISRVISETYRLHSKLIYLSSLLKNGTLACFRCGDSGHLARSCHNALVCFACNRVGHRSHSCHSITKMYFSSRPPLTREMKEKLSSLPVMRFASTREIRDFDVLLRRGLVIKDTYGKGASFISSQLSDRFPVDNFKWKAVPLTDDSFLIAPPDSFWRKIASEEGKILLGDIVFPLEGFDPVKFDGGWAPLSFWVKIYRLPSSFINGSEFERSTSELGSFIIQVDPLSKDRDNLKYLRLKLGVSERSDIPPCRKMLFLGPDGISRYYWIQFVVEGESRVPQRRFRNNRQGPLHPPSQGQPRLQPPTYHPSQPLQPAPVTMQPAIMQPMLPPLPPMPHPTHPPLSQPQLPPLPPVPHPSSQPPIQPPTQLTSQPPLLLPTPAVLSPIPRASLSPPAPPSKPAMPSDESSLPSQLSNPEMNVLPESKGVSEHNSFSTLANLPDSENIPDSYVLDHDPWIVTTVPTSPVYKPWTVIIE